MNNKQCCEWHDSLPDMWEDMGVPEDNASFGESPECGLAGIGNPSACCDRCPSIQHLKNRGLSIDYALEIAKLPESERP